MAISLNEYNRKRQDYVSQWQMEADGLEKLIDADLEKAISENLIPNVTNPNFVMRYKFKDKVSNEAKTILKMRYGMHGWFINENSDFKDAMIHGYFDFYSKKLVSW